MAKIFFIQCIRLYFYCFTEYSFPNIKLIDESCYAARFKTFIFAYLAKYQKGCDFFSNSKATQYENDALMNKRNRFGLLFVVTLIIKYTPDPLHIFISIVLHVIICKSEYSMSITFEEIHNNFTHSHSGFIMQF